MRKLKNGLREQLRAQKLSASNGNSAFFWNPYIKLLGRRKVRFSAVPLISCRRWSSNICSNPPGIPSLTPSFGTPPSTSVFGTPSWTPTFSSLLFLDFLSCLRLNSSGSSRLLWFHSVRRLPSVSNLHPLRHRSNSFLLLWRRADDHSDGPNPFLSRRSRPLGMFSPSPRGVGDLAFRWFFLIC